MAVLKERCPRSLRFNLTYTLQVAIATNKGTVTISTLPLEVCQGCDEEVPRK